MSILIKDMEMPNGCPSCQFVMAYYCLLIGISDDNEVTNYINERHPKCPLVEIPTPHGRLIDIKSVEDGKFTTVGNDYQRWWNGALESVVDNAPTVIEAEGSEE